MVHKVPPQLKTPFFDGVFYIFWGPAASGISSLWWFQSMCHQILRVDMVRLRLNPGWNIWTKCGTYISYHIPSTITIKDFFFKKVRSALKQHIRDFPWPGDLTPPTSSSPHQLIAGKMLHSLRGGLVTLVWSCKDLLTRKKSGLDRGWFGLGWDRYLNPKTLESLLLTTIYIYRFWRYMSRWLQEGSKVSNDISIGIKRLKLGSAIRSKAVK